MVRERWADCPNRTISQLRKNIVGPIKYSRTMNSRHNEGFRSKKKLKKRISEINMIVPGKPKKIKRFRRPRANNLGHKKLIPPTSVTSRVLKRLPIASTNKKELVERRA
jgi:hypothetical protein